MCTTNSKNSYIFSVSFPTAVGDGCEEFCFFPILFRKCVFGAV